jgi:pimeloyl-ACP methyl ester carboxylesterase
MTRARVNGIEIEHTVSGDGPAVLLSHGYSDTGRMWDGQREALAGYRMITWDMRGHGDTESPERAADYSLALTVADLHALLGHLGAPRAVVGGLSLGGYVSLAFALAHPETVRALVICDSGPGYRNPEARAGWNARAHARAARLEAEGLAALGGSRARREIAREGEAPAPAPVSSEAREYVPRHRAAGGLAHAARGMLAQTGPDVIDGLPSIAVPTLIIVGDHDEPFLAPSNYMAKKIPGARLVVIPGAGHWSNLDQPALFNRTVLDFLRSLPPA